MVVEPFQGEGGYVVPPTRFLSGLREICDEHGCALPTVYFTEPAHMVCLGILLVADEVQTGFGRTGKMLAMEHYGVTPDITVMAKGLASGFPVSAISSTTELMSSQPPGMAMLRSEPDQLSRLHGWNLCWQFSCLCCCNRHTRSHPGHQAC